MKKLLNKIRYNEPFFKFDLKMKLTTLFLFAALTITHANDIYSQKKQLSLNEKNIPVGKIIEKIETATNFRFVYNIKSVDLDRVISIKATNENIETVLKTIFKNTNTEYKISGTHIVLISKKDSTTSLETISQPNKEIVVTGKITNSKGETLPGVTVLEKGTTNAVASGFLGSYQIAVKGNNSILVFSFVGFSTKEVVVGNQTELNIVLMESVQELESVQVISTGFQKISRTKLTGAADNIDNRYFENSNKIRLQESLQGSIAGLQVLSNNSHPQSTPQVIIRGVGSAFQEGVNTVGIGQPTAVLGNPVVLTPGSPLYVIDGVSTFDGSDLSSINGNDIKSITVLKDAAAASIYGARAANGVIVVETKSGKKGKAIVNYSSQVGVSDFVSLGKSLNSSQLQELYVEGLINNPTNGINTESAALAFLAAPGTGLIPFNLNQNTDWGKELTRHSIVTQHNLSVSGGDNVNQYYVSLGYLKNETGVKNIDFDRLSLRLKYDTKLSDKFKIGTNIGYAKTESANYETGNSFYNPFRNIYRIRPDFAIYKEDGSYDLSYNSGVNPLGILTDETRNLLTNDFRGAINLIYQIIPNLSFENYVSANYKLTENYNNFPKYLGKGLNNGSSFGIQQNTAVFDWNARSLLRYDLNIGKDHHISTFAGIENNAIDTKITNVSVNNLRDGAETLDNGLTVNTYTKRNETSISSVFLNSDYDYQNKYLINASYRRDGSSKFGSSNRFGNFYAIGLGWNIHKEDFMANQNTFNLLKLRASYGVNGNDQIGNFNYVGTFDGTGSYNGENVIGYASAGNTSLGWEENETLNAGLDFSMFNNRISGYFDYYERNTSKLLYNLPTSALNGDGFIFQNFGGMKNSGFEITLNTKNIVSGQDGFNWTTGITFTSNKNKLTELKIDESVSGNYIRKVGEDFNTLYLFGYAGVDPQTGSELYYTDNTKAVTTTDITKAVKYNQGKTTPDFYGSFINTFTYKRITLLTQFYSSWGGQVFETNGSLQNDNGNAGLRDISNTSNYVYENRWQKPGDITDVPKYVYLNTVSSSTSTRWLHDASYVRLKKVELSYDFSNRVLENTFITKMRFYTGADNLWTYIKDETLQNDPEIGGISGSASFDAPLSTIVYFGINVTF